MTQKRRSITETAVVTANRPVAKEVGARGAGAGEGGLPLATTGGSNFCVQNVVYNNNKE